MVLQGPRMEDQEDEQVVQSTNPHDDLFISLFKVGDYIEVDSLLTGWIVEKHGEKREDLKFDIKFEIGNNVEKNVSIDRIRVKIMPPSTANAHATTKSSSSAASRHPIVTRNVRVGPPPPLSTTHPPNVSNTPTTTNQNSQSNTLEVLHNCLKSCYTWTNYGPSNRLYSFLKSGLE